MLKPNRLRELLAKTLPLFARNPERLQLFYSNGKIRATGAHSHSFQYAYELEILTTDFPYHPDFLFVPLLEFVRREQSELLHNPDWQENITFECEPNNNQTFDLYIKIPLTERVIVQNEGESYQVQHTDEPQPTEWQAVEKMTIFVKGEKAWES